MYRPVKRLMRYVLMPLLAKVDVEGREHIPRQGPFFLIPNHQSVLDPLIVQALCRRTVFSMTKSTQFSSKLMRWLLPRIGAFPVRRYRIDAQAVRTVLRLIEEGQGVGIYPEGERSWDGQLQPLRRGTIRVLLKAGVPIIPVGIAGSYDVWPRWSRRPRRCRVRLRYGEPIVFGPHADRRAREAALPAARKRLEAALRELVDETSGAREGEERVPERARPDPKERWA
ncbi:MAG: lysophospholipid acyltransferase family protein [Gemmatimonadota bacterium]